MVAAFPASLTSQDVPVGSTSNDTTGLVVGHPFSAIKYARRVKVLPNGKQQFLRNERYPTRIARDADGRLMMQALNSDDLAPECDRLDLSVPPPCPAWSVFVIDPVAHTITHWPEGETATHDAIEFPLTAARTNDAAERTATLPVLGPDFNEQDGKVTNTDLGDRDIDGVTAHGKRWTLHYDVNQDGRPVQRMRLHEVWTAPDMQLIVRVIDGDPHGEETVWGIEKVSLSPDAALFRPPDGYRIVHRSSDRWTQADFEELKSWFEK